MMKFENGMVHIYTGEGKGKTTAALGLGLRAIGCGLKVCFFQFFKDKRFPCGELDAIKQLGRNFKFKRFDIAHPCFKKIDAEKLKLQLKKAINEVFKAINSKKFDLIILDEVLIGVSQGFIDEKLVLKIIKLKPKEVELILTGRGATKRLIKCADYVTYMRCVKHPFDKKICARRGIEF